MIDSTLVIFTGNLAQALGAIVLALILAGFHRTYGRRYLLTWAWSWWAFCISQAGGAVALLLVLSQPSAPAPLRLAVSIVWLVAGYWQAALLLFGTYEVVTERELAARLRRAVLGALAVLAVVSVFVSLGRDPYARELVRVGLRLLFQGAAFVVASWGVWRRRSSPASGIGRRMVAGSFLLFGLHQLHYLVIIVARNLFTHSLGYVAYLGPFDFLFEALIGIGMVVWLLEDERQRVLVAADRIEHLAYHDPLTDLPNRNLLVQSLKEAVAGAEPRGERVAVLFLDLDRFKIVNESLGNRSGDELLRSVAERLRTGLAGTGLLARVAADEFAVLMPAVEGEAALFRMAEKLLAILRLPFALQGRELYLTASLGISRFPEDGGDAETLLKRAEIAMYRAKETRRDDYQIFTASMDSNTLEQLALEADLRKALAQEPGELVLFYQPVLDSERRVFEGVEALLRWRHPVRGLMAPGEFLWLADASGLAVPLDLWVLRQACREVQEWRAAGASELRLAVNLSPRSFQQPDLLQRIQGALAETGLPPFSLELEITETLAMHNAGATLSMLRGLKDLGVRIAIDDFGTGYSSLSYLTTFPIDTLKVDRSFVHTLGRGHGGEEVAAAVIALAVSLGLGVIAEGVETREQWRWLEGLGCDRFQGYLFSPPLPAFECRELILHGSVEERIRRAEFLLTGTEG
ncbi:MAG TPA: EAL domain-containing protein [Thermoanaerobaculia bacterium]|jgi:diguanylate cyclase (GGDEF)-like protein|nr:EAL domain-containing protein [Thermoanaerobaculia bacterium]